MTKYDKHGIITDILLGLSIIALAISIMTMKTKISELQERTDDREPKSDRPLS